MPYYRARVPGPFNKQPTCYLTPERTAAASEDRAELFEQEWQARAEAVRFCWIYGWDPSSNAVEEVSNLSACAERFAKQIDDARPDDPCAALVSYIARALNRPMDSDEYLSALSVVADEAAKAHEAAEEDARRLREGLSVDPPLRATVVPFAGVPA